MKKVLALILALTLIISCVPMIFANAITPDEQMFLDEFTRYQSSFVSFYNIDGKSINGKYLIDYGYQEVYEEIDNFEWFDEMLHYSSYGNWIKDNPSELAGATADLKSVNDKWDAYLAEKGYIRVLDATDLYYIALRAEFFYDDETYESFSDFVEKYIGDDIIEKLDGEYPKIENVMLKAQEDITSVTQKDLDEASKDYITIYSSIINCFEGNHIVGEYTDLGNGTHKTDCTFCKTTDITEAHTYGEYISDNNATTEADGTKTAKCTKCTATDTVADEGTKLPPEENNDSDSEDFFTSIINAIKNFFKQIADFFKNLFG